MMKKRFVPIILLTAMLTGSTPLYTSSAESRLAGDVNGDGKLSIADVVMCSRYVGEDTSVSLTVPANADINNDGNVDFKDVTAMLRTIARLPIAVGSASDCFTDGIQPRAVSAVNIHNEDFSAQEFDIAAKLLNAAKHPKQDGSPDNILLSPLSIEVALAMTANGAANNTLAQMEQFLCGENLDIDTLNTLLYAYRNELTSTDMVTMTNGIWFKNNDDIKPRQEFLESVVTYYDASIYGAPMDDSTVDDINAFVKEHTKERIPKIIDQLDPDYTRMVLVNALTFDGSWANEFEEKQNYQGLFHHEDGTTSNVTYMVGEADYNYESDDFVGFIKEYNGDMSFVGLMPTDSSVSLADFTASLDGETLQTMVHGILQYRHTCDLVLPQFKKDYSISLNEPLQDLGLRDMFFDGIADFSAMYQHSVYVSQVLHKTFIDVNNQGTAAAAVTAVVTKAECIPNRIVCDRPFVYMIYDNKADCPMFIGTVDQFNQ